MPETITVLVLYYQTEVWHVNWLLPNWNGKTCDSKAAEPDISQQNYNNSVETVNKR